MNGVGILVLLAVAALLPLVALATLRRWPWAVGLVALVVFGGVLYYRSLLDQHLTTPWYQVPLGLVSNAPVTQTLNPGPTPFGAKPYAVCISVIPQEVELPGIDDGVVDISVTLDGASEPVWAHTVHIGSLLRLPDWAPVSRAWCGFLDAPGPAEIGFDVRAGNPERRVVFSVFPGRGARLSGLMSVQRLLAIPVAIGFSAVALMLAAWDIIRRRRERAEKAEEE